MSFDGTVRNSSDYALDKSEKEREKEGDREKEKERDR